jgi:hypothetical protein
VKDKVWVLLLAWAFSGCGDDGPLAPSSPTSTGSAASPASGAGGTLSARVVNAVTGDPVGGASITVEGASFLADSDGVVRFERSIGGNVRVVVEASGYWPRETGMRPASQSLSPVTLSLMPDGDDFDLEFYDQVFRNAGEDGTHPWIFEPRFEIWEGLYECTGFTEGESCGELTAMVDRAPATFIETMRSVILADARQYSNSRVVGSNISTKSHPPGTVLSRSQYISPGMVSVAFVSTRDNFSWTHWRYNNTGPMIGAHININTRHRGVRGVYSHELAHTLGFAHPLGVDRVPLNSIMRQGHGSEPTRFDVLHGRVLYSRPADSRTPDIDPLSFLLNSLQSGAPEAGQETTREAR